MPFTLAHPAAIIALRRLRFLDIVPLIVGSMTPDLFGFLMPYGFTQGVTDSHSITGTLLIDVPFGYAFLLLLLVLQTPLTVLLWEPHRTFVRQTLARFFVEPKCWLIALPSLLLGSWTHILWDSFTHPDGWVVLHVPLLQRTLWPTAEHPMAMYHLLQYLCSLLGLLALGICYGYSLRASGLPHAHEGRWRKLLLSSMAALSVLGGTTAAATFPFGDGAPLYFRASITAVVAMTSFAMTYLLAGLTMTGWMALRGKARARSTR